mgnify:CR=1 FL=1
MRRRRNVGCRSRKQLVESAGKLAGEKIQSKTGLGGDLLGGRPLGPHLTQAAARLIRLEPGRQTRLLAPVGELRGLLAARHVALEHPETGLGDPQIGVGENGLCHEGDPDRVEILGLGLEVRLTGGERESLGAEEIGLPGHIEARRNGIPLDAVLSQGFGSHRGQVGRDRRSELALRESSASPGFFDPSRRGLEIDIPRDHPLDQLVEHRIAELPPPADSNVVAFDRMGEKLHPIADLLDACWAYAEKRANRFITFEYVMLRGVNDSLAHADQLYELLRNRPAKVNLIPFNPFPGTVFKRSSVDTIQHFQNRLRQLGLVATTRRTRGDDIDAACGQLAGEVSNRVRNRLGEKKIGESRLGDRNQKVASA